MWITQLRLQQQQCDSAGQPRAVRDELLLKSRRLWAEKTDHYTVPQKEQQREQAACSLPRPSNIHPLSPSCYVLMNTLHRPAFSTFSLPTTAFTLAAAPTHQVAVGVFLMDGTSAVTPPPPDVQV